MKPVSDPSDENIPLADYLCLALYRTSREVTGLYRDWLEELNLTYPQYLVMRLLWQQGPVGVGDIADALNLDYGTLSPLLKRLENAGLIQRQRRREDERAVEVHLTTDGQALKQQASDIPGKLTCAIGLSTQDSATLRKLLARVSNAIQSS